MIHYDRLLTNVCICTALPSLWLQRGFHPLLDATATLRKEQEEEARLADRLAGQHAELTSAEGRYAAAARQLAEVRATSWKDDVSAMGHLEAQRRSAEEARRLAKKTLPAALRARKEALAKLRTQLAEPRHTDDDISALQASVRQLEQGVAAMTSELTSAQRAAGDDKLAIFRQQASAMSRRLGDKAEAVEAARREVAALWRELDEKVCI